MQDIWRRFVAALASYSPVLATHLNPGVDDATIHKAEQRLGVSFTEEVKEFFYLQNGSNGPLFGSWAFLSLEEMCDDWLTMKEKFPFPGQPGDGTYYSWKENWLPLLWASSFLRLYIRIDPKDEALEEEALSAQEQDFSFQYGIIPPERLGTLFLSSSRADFVAASINEFLENLIRALEQKEYVYDKDIQGLRTLDSMSSRLLRVNEPSLYELDADFPDVDLSFGDRVAYPGLCCLPSRRDYSEQFSLTGQRSITQNWELFRASIEQMAPEMIKDFGVGVPIADLQRIEEQMHVHFPEDFKEWYSFCNGMTMLDEEGVHSAIDFWIGIRWKTFINNGSSSKNGTEVLLKPGRSQESTRSAQTHASNRFGGIPSGSLLCIMRMEVCYVLTWRPHQRERLGRLFSSSTKVCFMDTH
jgi:Protein involved in beta-1,3-glucan synthesis